MYPSVHRNTSPHTHTEMVHRLTLIAHQLQLAFSDHTVMLMKCERRDERKKGRRMKYVGEWRAKKRIMKGGRKIWSSRRGK